MRTHDHSRARPGSGSGPYRTNAREPEAERVEPDHGSYGLPSVLFGSLFLSAFLWALLPRYSLVSGDSIGGAAGFGVLYVMVLAGLLIHRALVRDRAASHRRERR